MKIIITPGTTAYLPPAKPGIIEPKTNDETKINENNIIKEILSFFFFKYNNIIKKIEMNKKYIKKLKY